MRGLTHAGPTPDGHASRAVLTAGTFMVILIPMKSAERPRRVYRMTARAKRQEATRVRILEAALRLSVDNWIEDITFKDVASAAGVGLQTVIRHFGSHAELIRAAAEQANREVLSRRFEAPPGDPEAALDNLLDHYERDGDRVLRVLAQEDRVPDLRPFLEAGREGHRRWVEAVLGPLLEDGSPHGRRARLTELAAVTDVYLWKLLRKDHGFTPAEYRLAVARLVQCLISTKEES